MIFALVRKYKSLSQNLNSIKKVQGFVETLQIMSSKMTGRFCTDEVRVKVPSFQKVTLFSVK